MAIYSAGTSVANAGSLVGAGDSTDEQAVGTYHLSYYGSATALDIGATTAGSNLYDNSSENMKQFSTERHDQNSGTATNTGYSGTWRNMHCTAVHYSDSYKPTTLFVRVS